MLEKDENPWKWTGEGSMGQLEGAGKERMGEKKEKLGFFLQFSGFIGICWKKEEGNPSWDSSAGGNSCPAAQCGAGAALPCGKLRKTQLVWRKPTGNPAGTGLVYLEKGKSGMRGGTSRLLGLVWPKSIGFTPWNGNKIGEPPIWGILPRLAGRGLIGSQCCRESALICIFA